MSTSPLGKANSGVVTIPSFPQLKALWRHLQSEFFVGFWERELGLFAIMLPPINYHPEWPWVLGPL